MTHLPNTFRDGDGHLWVRALNAENAYYWDDPKSTRDLHTYEWVAENFGVAPTSAEPFPKGTIVRFKPTRYRVLDFDGESHDLEAIDPDAPEHNLLSQPDFFEAVSYPEVEEGSVYEDSVGNWFLVGEERGKVRVVDSYGIVTHLTHEQFHSRYTRVL